MGLIDKDILELRIKNNLDAWEDKIEKHYNLPYSNTLAKFIKNNKNIRVIMGTYDTSKNEKMGYSLCKHLVNSGVPPSSISMIDAKDCYLYYNDSWAEQGKELREKVYNKDIKTILLENCRTFSQIGTKDSSYNIGRYFDNIDSFMKDIIHELSIDNSKNLIICISRDEKGNYPNWLTDSYKKKLVELGFKEIR